jgi:hypothetical protein
LVHPRQEPQPRCLDEILGGLAVDVERTRHAIQTGCVALYQLAKRWPTITAPCPHETDEFDVGTH